uniref:Methyltransferase type 11 domain-containing protein n=1 Tax=Quercus lobata TaxID=97700 RepID=A0A7N2M329_QUELO
MTSANQVPAHESACQRVEARGRRVSARARKLQRVVARVARDQRRSSFERRVEARVVSNGGEASTNVVKLLNDGGCRSGTQGRWLDDVGGSTARGCGGSCDGGSVSKRKEVTLMKTRLLRKAVVVWVVNSAFWIYIVWVVGRGFGSVGLGFRPMLVGIYKNVIATDTSPKQLEFAPRLPNIRYQLTPPTMSIAELESSIAPQSSIDIVTIAQALHWFDLPNFYQQAELVLKKPHGIIAAWCYTVPEYETIDFPFEPVDGADHTGPFPFVMERLIDLDNYFTCLRSWSAYQTAKEKGVELLSNDVIEEFKRAWTEDGQDKKVVKHPIYLRIGRVGNE